jgi:hypothetical protein
LPSLRTSVSSFAILVALAILHSGSPLVRLLVLKLSLLLSLSLAQTLPHYSPVEPNYCDYCTYQGCNRTNDDCDVDEGWEYHRRLHKFTVPIEVAGRINGKVLQLIHRQSV